MDPVIFLGMIVYIYYIDIYNYDEILYDLVNLILLLGFGNAEDHLTNNLNGILGYLSIFNNYFSFFSNYYLEVFCILGQFSLHVWAKTFSFTVNFQVPFEFLFKSRLLIKPTPKCCCYIPMFGRITLRHFCLLC